MSVSCKCELLECRNVLLQLLLLNEATVVLVNDFEGLLDIIRGLASQAACGEELLVVEGVSSCSTSSNIVSTLNSQSTGLVLMRYDNCCLAVCMTPPEAECSANLAITVCSETL